MGKKPPENEDPADMEEAEVPADNRMGSEPLHGLMVKMAIPMMLSMLVQSLYNVVDSIFVSRINEDALSAVTMCFPVQALTIAVAIGTGVGMSALLSRYLGAKEFDKVNSIAQNGLFLAGVGYLIFLLISFASHPFMAAQIKDPRIVEYGTTYLTIVTRYSMFIFVEIIFERYLQSTGKTMYVLFVQGSGALVNIILDPILIFGLLGAPKLGIAGAAYATIIGEAVGALAGLLFNKKKNKEIDFRMRGFRPDGREISAIYKIGLPSIVMQSIASLMVLCFNTILAKFGSTTIATFGIYFRLQSFVFMPVFGFNNAVVPIIAYNYGARKSDRMKHAMKISARYGIGIMLAGLVIFWLFPNELLSMFNPSERMLEIGRSMLRIISLNFPFAGYAIMRGAVFQALGKSIYSMNIAIIRQIGVLIPVAFLLSLSGDVNMIWLAFPLAEIVGFTMSILYTKKIRREIIEPLSVQRS